MVFLQWLITAALGPAAFALPVNWAADALASAASRWFKRLRGTDDLSRLVAAATGHAVVLTKAEFKAVRQLLEDQQTWSDLGRGTVEDLAGKITSCLEKADGRTSGNLQIAGRSIAAGLLEFAVADLEPKMFQKVLFARLNQMEQNDAREIEKALFGLHADLMTRFDGVAGQLKRVLDRLPPAPAGRGEIALYLTTLIAWVSTDPWLSRQFSDPALSPAATERRLMITSAAEEDRPADDLGRDCQRLVILGGPGSGKTWLAKRIVRQAAVHALEALARGDGAAVELPLYTTCSALCGAAGNIREAVVTSALDQLPDLGGSRIYASVRMLFTERNEPTLLVIDSLDEARNPGKRLSQADNFSWRIVLTSRPSSWERQLTLDSENTAHVVGELQPLSYPGDVEPFVRHWFRAQPERGEDLLAQIGRQVTLQQTAVVPLMLAFYCVISGSGPLPEFRQVLYNQLLQSMLTGAWHGDDTPAEYWQPDHGVCLATLRSWAWDGATTDPVSGVGTWADEIRTERARLTEADADAVDHIAPPVRHPGYLNPGQTYRRFVHRSVREHLVAEYIRTLPVPDAAGLLLPHLWYDPDWEYVIPEAIASHPAHDQLMRELICRAAGTDQIPADWPGVEAGWELRRLLSRTAAQSRETDWSPDIAEMIGRARVELARWAVQDPYDWPARIGELAGMPHWATSNRLAREALLELLADEASDCDPATVVPCLVRLAPTEEDTHQVRASLLELLFGQTDAELATVLAKGISQLAPALSDRISTSQALLTLLGDQDSPVAGELIARVAGLARTEEEKRHTRQVLLGLLGRPADGELSSLAASAIVQLDGSPDERRQARDILIGLLTSTMDFLDQFTLITPISQCAVTGKDRLETRGKLMSLFVAEDDPADLMLLGSALSEFSLTAEDRRRARGMLLGQLDRHTDVGGLVVLAGLLDDMAPAAEDRRSARAVLLSALAAQTDPDSVISLARSLSRLRPDSGDKQRAREALLGLLAGPCDAVLAGKLGGLAARFAETSEDRRQVRAALLRALAAQDVLTRAEDLLEVAGNLAPTAEDRRQVRDIVLKVAGSRAGAVPAGQLLSWMIQFTRSAGERSEARAGLLGLLAGPAGRWSVESLVDGVVQLARTALEKRQVCAALVNLLLSSQADVPAAAKLAREIAQLDPTADERHRARDALLDLLPGHADRWSVESLVDGAVRLAQTAQERRPLCAALSGLLPGQTDGYFVAPLARGIAQLDPAADQKRQARAAILNQLSTQADVYLVQKLTDALAELDPTEAEKRQARVVLLGLLASGRGQLSNVDLAVLLSRVTYLGATVTDPWANPRIPLLFAEVRRNSALSDWLGALHVSAR